MLSHSKITSSLSGERRQTRKQFIVAGDLLSWWSFMSAQKADGSYDFRKISLCQDQASSGDLVLGIWEGDYSLSYPLGGYPLFISRAILYIKMICKLSGSICNHLGAQGLGVFTTAVEVTGLAQSGSILHKQRIAPSDRKCKRHQIAIWKHSMAFNGLESNLSEGVIITYPPSVGTRWRQEIEQAEKSGHYISHARAGGRKYQLGQ